MELAVSNIGWEGKDDSRVYCLMKKYGCTGLEIAPTRIFPETPYDKLEEAKEWGIKLKEEWNFTVPSMQSIWFGRQERLFGSIEERERLIGYTKKAIDFAAVVGCKNLVFGCPKNRNCPENADLNIAINFFREIGEYAFHKGTVVGMEANPTIYHTNYINDTLSALELIREVNSKGFLLNLDVGTMVQNQEKVLELIGQVKYINHVHISEPGLQVIKRRELHKELKELLFEEGYLGFISIEMGKTDTLIKLEEALQYVREVF